jgi:hypothetical protein
MVCYLVTIYYTAFEEKTKGVTLELFTKMKMSSKICLFLPKIFILLLFFGCRKTQTQSFIRRAIPSKKSYGSFHLHEKDFFPVELWNPICEEAFVNIIQHFFVTVPTSCLSSLQNDLILGTAASSPKTAF